MQPVKSSNNYVLEANNFMPRVILVILALFFCSVALVYGLLANIADNRRVIINPEFTKILIIFVGVGGLVVGVGSVIGLIRIKSNNRILLNISNNMVFATNLLHSTLQPLSSLRNCEVKKYSPHKWAQSYLLLHFDDRSFNVPLDITTVKPEKVENIVKNLITSK